MGEVCFCLGHSDEGNCGAQFVRWFWNGEARVCESFAYTGCSGNGNNFASREECLSICHREGKTHLGFFFLIPTVQQLATNRVLTRPTMFATRTLTRANAAEFSCAMGLTSAQPSAANSNMVYTAFYNDLNNLKVAVVETATTLPRWPIAAANALASPQVCQKKKALPNCSQPAPFVCWGF